MIGRAIRFQFPENNKDLEMVITIDRHKANLDKIAEYKGIIAQNKLLDITIKKHRNKRSLDANAYCFVLCQKIAEKVGNTKEYVYRQAIKNVGQFEIVPIRNDALEKWMNAWNSKGLGWISEVFSESKIEGYTNTINYYGSSVYDSKEMALLINEIVEQAKELEIDTITESEKQSLIENWKGDN